MRKISDFMGGVAKVFTNPTFMWVMVLINLIVYVITNNTTWGIWGLVWLAYIIIEEIYKIQGKLDEIQKQQKKYPTFPWW